MNNRINSPSPAVLSKARVVGAAAVAVCLLLAIAKGSAASRPDKRPESASPRTAPSEKLAPELGINSALNGAQVMPDNDPWRMDVSKLGIDPRSAAIIASIGADKPLHPDFGTVWQGNPMGIPYVVVGQNQERVAIKFTDYGNESDPGPYPIPPNAPIEGGAKSDGDRHVIVLDRDNWILYELFHAFPNPDGSWRASSGAIFDLKVNKPRPAGWTSADAAGLPVFPGLVRHDEVVDRGEITHALRFTVQRSRRAYLPPARHFASKSEDENLPPMGMRVRLRADFDIKPFPKDAQVVLTALKHYGMIVADNGSDWFLSGAPDPQWDDEALDTLKRVRGRDFEVIRMEGLVTQ